PISIPRNGARRGNIRALRGTTNSVGRGIRRERGTTNSVGRGIRRERGTTNSVDMGIRRERGTTNSVGRGIRRERGTANARRMVQCDRRASDLRLYIFTRSRRLHRCPNPHIPIHLTSPSSAAVLLASPPLSGSLV